ncbi:hypothetical protein [uncultured Treponema sp.]|uniref:hypothetical protein n=1 Tax=uncultured Treponema sp. TaxID=162155 RepID=UPI0025F53CB5|nr:hypothetical protein [uncultured Treponema sp.]
MNNFWEKVKLFFIDAKNKIVSFFEKLKNSFCEFLKSLQSKISTFFERLKNSKAQKDSNLKDEPEEPKIKKTVGKKIGFAFLNFFDIIFDLVFAAVIILILKPEIRNGNSLCNKLSIVDFVKNNLSENFLFLVFLLALLAAYFIFKFIFSFIYVRGLQRISCAMIVVLSIVSIFLLPTNILFFILFYFLLYITFQISCGIKPSCAIYKLIAVIVLDITLYFELHLIYIKEVQMQIETIQNSIFEIIGYLKI